MRNLQVLNTAKCLVCSVPRIGTVGNWLISSVQKTSSLLGTAAATKTARPFCSLPSTSAVGSSGQASSGCLQGAKLNVSAASQTEQFPTKASFLAAATPMFMQSRGRAQVYYRPSAWRRVNKHGIEQRLRSEAGIDILWRRFLKKRHVLSPFDRILPGTADNGQILPKHHLKFNKHLIDQKVKQRVKEALKKR